MRPPTRTPLACPGIIDTDNDCTVRGCHSTVARAAGTDCHCEKETSAELIPKRCVLCVRFQAIWSQAHSHPLASAALMAPGSGRLFRGFGEDLVFTRDETTPARRDRPAPWRPGGMIPRIVIRLMNSLNSEEVKYGIKRETLSGQQNNKKPAAKTSPAPYYWTISIGLRPLPYYGA